MKARIRKYLEQGEGECLDYKQTITDARKIAKSMSAFSNHKGGVLLIGVKDNRKIKGIETEEEKYMLELAADFYCKPRVSFEIKEHEIGGKIILECIIPEGKDKPYAAEDADGKFWVYIRVKDKSLLASKVVVDVLRRQNSNRGTTIKYGKNEQALLAYLADNERITLMKFKKMMNISKWRASKILVNLISTGVIRSHTTEKTEFYTLS